MNENEMEDITEINPDSELLESEGLGGEGDNVGEEAEAEVIPSELEPIQVRSILESILLASDKPLGTSFFKEIFKGTNIKTPQIREAIEALTLEYTGAERGLTLVEIGGGFQLRTKSENSVFVRRMMKGRPFKLSGPALEVLAIIAYKQPLIKAEVDEIRGVESGHLMRALMDRGLIRFDGKSEVPGKPMLYGTTRKFLEIFGLKDLRELPTLSEIDQLIPEGIGDMGEEKEEKLGDMQSMGLQYHSDPDREVEWEKITAEISEIKTSTDFFEQEKARERAARDKDRADDIRERVILGEEVEEKDKRWLARYEAKMNPAPDAVAVHEPEAAESMAASEGSDSDLIEETYPLDNENIALESVVADTFPSGQSQESSGSEIDAATGSEAGKLTEILEGLKNKNAGAKDSDPSDREHLKQSVYRPDQLKQALKDFDSDD